MNKMRLNIPMQQFNLRRYFYTTSKCLNKFNNQHYKVLGIEQSARQAEIKKAFYQLSKKYHPDALSSANNSVREFIKICEAYETLRNEQKRRIYDNRMSEYVNKTTLNYQYAQNQPSCEKNIWDGFYEKTNFANDTKLWITQAALFLGTFVLFTFVLFTEQRWLKRWLTHVYFFVNACSVFISIWIFQNAFGPLKSISTYALIGLVFGGLVLFGSIFICYHYALKAQMELERLEEK